MFLYAGFVQAQQEVQEHAWVYFKNKPDAVYFLQAPHLMLSQKALDRRSKQGLAPNEQDVPLCPDYVSSVATGTGITVKARSKWLNAVHVLGTEFAISNLQNLTGVDSIQFANKNINAIQSSTTVSQQKKSKINQLKTIASYSYGNATNQTTMLGVDTFHNATYEGQGLQIAIIDSGFFGTDTAGAFHHLVDGDFSNGEILGGHNYVNNTTDFYAQTGSTHGTQVLSTIAGVIEGEFVGTAPKASFYLFVTEDVDHETPLEESLWVQAAEKADSLGVDIINTSLGYSEFDESKYNYTYADMDGKTTFISRGATIAAQKGMIVVNSAGNSGNDSWKYITAPADADGVISVGAVDTNESVTAFSSYGPTADNRIKPETLAQGGDVFVVEENNTVVASNGTSFSGPIISGVSACLWQAFPNKTSVEIRQMIIENSEDYLNPTAQGGYGILRIGHLASQLTLSPVKEIDKAPFYLLFLNHSKVIQFQFYKPQTEVLKVELFSVTGRVLERKEIKGNYNQVDISSYANGLYYLRYRYQGKNQIMTLYKID
ncbi:hypothetical protein GGR97_002647 [Wenyingzhuangia aestuarii]|nr:hypothetical protein [Wenyingzhuangia aestuarii]